MSKFLRTMTALSKKPSDFKAPAPVQERSQALNEQPLSISGVPDKGVPDTGIPIKSVPEQDSINLAESAAEVAPLRSPRKVREAVRVQDGHSLGEQAVYASLWAAGQPHNEDCRRITIGYRALSDACGLTVNNCKANLQSLRKKLAIEEWSAATRKEATTYLVYGYQAILRRRRQVGMTHVIKTKGVIFVNSATGIPVSGTPLSSWGVPVPGAPDIKPGIPVSDKSGIPVPGALIRNKNSIEELTSSSAITTLQQTTAKEGIVLDDDAARKLIRRCRTIREDVTDSEIAYFTQIKIDQLRNSKNVENWVGMLIASVPAYFEGDAPQLLGLREQGSRQLELAQAQAEAQQREMDALLVAQKRVMDDPESSDEDKALARKILGL
jgi:hypothetical protein